MRHSHDQTKLIFENWRQFFENVEHEQLLENEILLEEQELNEVTQYIVEEYLADGIIQGLEEEDQERLDEVLPLAALAAGARAFGPSIIRGIGTLVAKKAPALARKVGLAWLPARGSFPARLAAVPGTKMFKVTNAASRLANTKLGKVANVTSGFLAQGYLYDKAMGAMAGAMGGGDEELKGIADEAEAAMARAEEAQKAGDQAELAKIQAELEQLKSQAKGAADKAKGKIRRVGGMRLRGARKLQAAGYGADLDASKNYRQIYDQFYSALDKAGISLKKDYLFGRKHSAALQALQSGSKASKNDMSSTNVKPAGTAAPRVPQEAVNAIVANAKKQYVNAAGDDQRANVVKYAISDLKRLFKGSGWKEFDAEDNRLFASYADEIRAAGGN